MTLKHPRLVHALMALRPNARPLQDFLVEDFGDGPVLREGSMINPPTQSQIDVVTPSELDLAQQRKNPGRATKELLASLTIDDLSLILRTTLGGKRADELLSMLNWR